MLRRGVEANRGSRTTDVGNSLLRKMSRGSRDHCHRPDAGLEAAASWDPSRSAPATGGAQGGPASRPRSLQVSYRLDWFHQAFLTDVEVATGYNPAKRCPDRRARPHQIKPCTALRPCPAGPLWRRACQTRITMCRRVWRDSAGAKSFPRVPIAWIGCHNSAHTGGWWYSYSRRRRRNGKVQP